jgi:hypothetical protein
MMYSFRYWNIRGKQLLLAIACFLPFVLSAQDASGIISINQSVKDTARQTDLIDILKTTFHIKPQKARMQGEKKVYFSLLPVTSTVAGGAGRMLVTSTSAAMYLGPRSTTNLSSATFTPYWNFNGRFGLPLRTSVWLPNNTWTIQGDTRFLVYPQYTWGLGSSRNDTEEVMVDYKYIRFYQSALKKIKTYLFAGAGYHLDYHFNIRTDDTMRDLKQYAGYAYGTGSNSFSSGFSIAALYDTRNNSLNPLPGSYANLVYRMNARVWGSNDGWQSLYADVRKYISLRKYKDARNQTLALWSYVWTVLGGKVPYLDLPSIGWDPANRSGRGIDQNRYRGKTLLYFETEYRHTFRKDGLLGFVLFTNINSVSGSGSFFKTWHPAAGAGMRVKFNKGSNTNIGVDFAFSKGYSAVLFNLGEAF